MVQMCQTAFDHGINHFDLANNYGPIGGAAEENFGRILSQRLGEYRDELLISTKAGYTMWPGPYGNFGSKKYLVASLDQSLKRMGLEYVDIFYHHRPDPDTSIEETAAALDGIVKSGKALYIGLSNYNQEQMEAAMVYFREYHTPFVIQQRRYSIMDRTIEKDGTKAFCAEQGIGMITYSPLEQGLLTNRYLHGIPADSRVRKEGSFLSEANITESVMCKIRSLNEIATQRGESLAQMALSWILRDGEVNSVLIGASKPEQILDNLGILSSAPFTQEECARIDHIVIPVS
jgi:L-glyceraldehyde 3-phosphate reductase